MRLLTSIAETRRAIRAVRTAPDTTLGLVPTMGALHEGHLSLVRAARQRCASVAVSIFINPTQFGPNEDLDRYPRTLDTDLALLEGEGVDLIFAPTAIEMYPSNGLGFTVDPGDLGNRLDGQSRPGHFRGVATVVSKLFHILSPDRAFFGQKDAAQVAVLRAMVRDLNFPVELVVCPTVRDADGLALSSRNLFLTPEQRTQALALSQALACAGRRIHEGLLDAKTLVRCIENHLASAHLRTDYVAVVDADSLLPREQVDNNSLLALAAYVGDTRLIDNLLIRELPSKAPL